jgi:hypothetical protein
MSVQNRQALKMHTFWKHSSNQEAIPEAIEKPLKSEALEDKKIISDVVAEDLEIEEAETEASKQIINRCSCGREVTEDMSECPNCEAELTWGYSK